MRWWISRRKSNPAVPDRLPGATESASARVIVVLAAILVLIWPVAGTIYLRYALLGTLALLTLPQFRALRSLSAAGPLVAATALLTVWLTVIAYRSPYAPYAVSELWWQWYKALAIGLVGATVGLACSNALSRRMLLNVWVAGLSLLAILAASADWALAVPRPLPDLRGQRVDSGPMFVFNNKTNVSYVINSALALLAAEIVRRARGLAPYLMVSDRLLYVMVAGLLGSMIYFRAQNSAICLVVTVLIAFAFAWRDRVSGGARMQRALTRLAIVFVAVATVTAIAFAPRLKAFGETIAVAFDTETHRAWMAPTHDFPGAYPWPTLRDGTPVDQSLYQRAAWFKEGVMIVIAHPLGLGFGRDAFGWALHMERDIGTAAPSASGVPQGIPINSHSALLELAIGGGVPGVVLVLAVLLLAMRIGFRAYRDSSSAAGLMMVLLVADFSCRMMIDANFRDHSLQMLMFEIGAFAAFAQEDATRDSAPGAA